MQRVTRSVGRLGHPGRSTIGYLVSDRYSWLSSKQLCQFAAETLNEVISTLKKERKKGKELEDTRKDEIFVVK
jgi:hypothetical protein